MIGLERSRGGRTNRRVSLQTSCFPVVSHGTTPCAVKRRASDLRYNKQLIAQLVGRHEDLSHPEMHVSLGLRPRATLIFWMGQIFISPD